jgi:uncharacterized membrane protein YecN with MAPEG domain
MRERPPLLAPLAGLAAAWAVWRGFVAVLPLAPAPDMSHRIGLACAALLPTVALLLVMILAQMAVRGMTGAIDPTAGRDGRFLQVNQRALTNTVEQLAAFIPSLLALAAGAGAAGIGQVVALALVFAVARLAFWTGYLAGARLRAPGMAATVAVNLVTLAAAARVWLT